MTRVDIFKTTKVFRTLPPPVSSSPGLSLFRSHLPCSVSRSPISLSYLVHSLSFLPPPGLISPSFRKVCHHFPPSPALSLSFLSLYPPFHCFFHPFFISLPSHPHMQKTYCHNLLFRRMKPVSMRSASKVKII